MKAKNISSATPQKQVTAARIWLTRNWPQYRLSVRSGVLRVSARELRAEIEEAKIDMRKYYRK